MLGKWTRTNSSSPAVARWTSITIIGRSPQRPHLQDVRLLERAGRHHHRPLLVIPAPTPRSARRRRRAVMGGASGPTAPSCGAPSHPAADALLYSNVDRRRRNGAAVGWGMELAMMADIRVASGEGEVRRAVRAAWLCTDVRRHRPAGPVVGGERRPSWLFTASDRRQTAKDIGLVSRVVPRQGHGMTVADASPQTRAGRPADQAGLRRSLDPDWRQLGDGSAPRCRSCFVPTTIARA